MTRIKVNVAATARLLALSAGDTFLGLPVVESTPGGQGAILEVPDSLSADDIDLLADEWLQRGLIVPSVDSGLWRYEHTDYVPLGWPVILPDSVAALYAPGDTFGLLGITEDIRRRGKYGAGVLVGVCDTGCAQHPWFQGKGVAGDFGVDTHGHGTHVCGTILGQEGIASDATLYVRNVLPGGSGTESGVAEGIRDCANRNVRVLNLSLGGGASQVIDDACTYARQLGVVVCAAAGNSTNAAIGSPARAADLIVMAFDRAREWASFTDGRGWDNPNRVGAPGVNIVSAAPGGGTQVMSGTSMATPHMVGVAALLFGGGV